MWCPYVSMTRLVDKVHNLCCSSDVTRLNPASQTAGSPATASTHLRHLRSNKMTPTSWPPNGRRSHPCSLGPICQRCCQDKCHKNAEQVRFPIAKIQVTYKWALSNGPQDFITTTLHRRLHCQSAAEAFSNEDFQVCVWSVHLMPS